MSEDRVILTREQHGKIEFIERGLAYGCCSASEASS
jgi:hypothetical protein